MDKPKPKTKKEAVSMSKQDQKNKSRRAMKEEAADLYEIMTRFRTSKMGRAIMAETDQNRQVERKKRKYTSAIFDLDGTILDRPSTVPQEANLAALKLLRRMRHDIATLEEELKHVYSQTTQEGGFLVPKKKQFALLLRNLGISSNDLVEKLFQLFLTRYLSLVDLFPSAVETLTTLSGLGMRIGLATNGPEDLVNDVIGHFNLHNVFDFIVTSSQGRIS